MENSRSFQRPFEGETSFMRYATKGERRVAEKLVQCMLDRGYTVSVQDGYEWTVKHSTRLQPVLDALCTTGEDNVRCRNKDGAIVGTFTLIWGNAEDGEELISDYGGGDEADVINAYVAGELTDH